MITIPSAFVVDLYRCFDQNPHCSLGRQEFLNIEEIGWTNIRHPIPSNYEPTPADFQKLIYGIGSEMGRRMKLGYGMGRCILWISNRLLTQLDGCVKISRQGCHDVQSWILSSWTSFAAKCAKMIDLKSNSCLSTTLPEFNEFNREVVFINDQEPEGVYVPAISRLFSLALDRVVSIKGREPSCDTEKKKSYLSLPRNSRLIPLDKEEL